MPITSVANLVEELQRNRLLDTAQLGAVGQQLQPRCADPRALAKELLQRGWLTSFQINRLFQGRGKELVLGSYVLLEPLGEGGMGQVFKARHLRLDRIDAVKVIRKQLLADPNSVQRFQREARAAARLSHPNVITVYDAGEVGDVHFLAMEYVAGVDLGRMVKLKGPLSIGQACDYIRQAAVGLQHAHERGLIHRDIKPANLLLTSDGSTVKLLDLGLARLQSVAAEQSHNLTDTGAVVGTPDYIAPEQARNAKEVDIRADLYSLGCSLYYLLAGRSPFTGETLTEKLIKHQLEDAPPLEELRPEVPPELAAIVRKLMAKKPPDRYQTPAEVAAVLVPFANNSSTDVLPSMSLVNLQAPGPSVPLAAPVSAMAETLPGGKTVRLPSSTRPGSRRSLLLVAGSAGALFVVLVIGGGLWWLMRGSPERRAVAGPTSPTTVRADPEQAKRYAARGKEHLDAKQYDQAINQFTEAIRLDPQSVTGYLGRGQAYLAKSDNDRAIADLSRAIQLEPNNDHPYFDRAAAYFNKGDYAKSLADNTTVIRLRPTDAAAYSNRGTIYQHQGKTDEAILEYDQAIRLSPTYAAAWSNRGNCHSAKRRYVEAAVDFTEVIRLEPRNADAYFHRGVARYYLKEYDPAVEDLTETIRLEPKSARAFFYRSRAYEKRGSQAMSDADYKTAVRLDPQVARFKKD